MENGNHVVLQNTHKLSFIQRLSYSVGHVFNDLCAAVWFTYLLVFMHYVNGFSSDTSGTLMLVGQIADGLATPFIGVECDRKLNWPICRYGQRKAWHLFGTICVFVSFPFLFNRCIMCEDSSEKSQIVYYSAFIIIFQIGWAAVQISHLSLIPDLTPISSERVGLNAFRYCFTVFSTITVYLAMFILLKVNSGNDVSQITSEDYITFREVTFIILGLGVITSIIFHLGVTEKRASAIDVSEERQIGSPNSTLLDAKPKTMVWQSWFKQSQFYKVALLYMGTRLTINLTQVYIPTYLQETLFVSKDSVAYIPLVIYSSGFLSSFVMKYINMKLGKRMTFLIGSLISLSASTWIYFGNGENFKKYEIFAVSVLIGMASTTMLITSLAITSDLIGSNTSSGAFVFGAMSFVDKVSNGLTVMIVEQLKPCSTCACLYCDFYYRNVLTFVVGGSTAIAIVALALLSTQKIDANGYIVVTCVEPVNRLPQQEHPSLSSPLLDNYEDSS